MKKTLLTLIITFFVILSNGQNPLPALRAYEYHTDNNRINLEKKLKKDYKPLVFTNVFFQYFKNPLYNQTFSSCKIMLIKVQYEYVLQTVIKANDNLNFCFRFNRNDDKVIKRNLTSYRHVKGKIKRTKLLKNRDFQVIITDTLITIKPYEDRIKEGDIFRIFLSIESSDINLDDLSPLNKIDNARNLVSLHVPEFFQYGVQLNQLELLGKEKSEMKLIKFSYDVSNLTEQYNVSSITYNLSINNDRQIDNLLFPLVSIDLPIGIGVCDNQFISIKE